MNEYLPTTDEVRDAYDYKQWLGVEDESRVAEFDRWLEQVQAEAWKEGYVAGFLKAMGGELDGSAREAATRVPVQGEPTPEQVEAAAKAIADCHNPGMFEKYPENWRVEARAALVAAAALDGAPEPEEKP